MLVDPARGTGRSTEIIKAMPELLGEDRLFFVGSTQMCASNLRPLIREIKGEDYERRVDCRGVKDIHMWGKGIWSDSIVFDHTVWDEFSDLTKADQDFIVALTTEISLGKFFDVKKSKSLRSKAGLFTRIRRAIASWIMP